MADDQHGVADSPTSVDHAVSGSGPNRGPRRWHVPPQAARLVHDARLLGPAYLIPGLASFATIPALFAALGPAEYGRWAILYGIAAGVPQVTTSWLEARLVRFSYLEPGRWDRGRSALAAGGSIVVSAPLAAIVLPAVTLPEVVAAAVLTAAVSRYLLMVARLQSAMHFAAVSVAASTRSMLGAGLGILLGAITGVAALAIGGLGTGYLVGELAGSLWARRSRRSEGSAPVPVGAPATAETADAVAAAHTAPGVVRDASRAAYEVASGVNAVAQYELQVGDRFIMSATRPLSDVGVYTATYALVDLAGRFMPAIVLGVVRPRVYRAWDADRPDRAFGLVVALAAVLGWLVAASVTVLVTLSLVIPRLPVEPGLAGPIGLGFACFVAAGTLGLVYSAATRQGRLAIHSTIAALVNIGLNVALIPGLGPLGAALATAVSYAVLLVAQVGGLRDLPFDRATVATLGSGVLALACLSIPGSLLATPGSVALATLACVGGLVGVIRLGRTALREG